MLQSMLQKVRHGLVTEQQNYFPILSLWFITGYWTQFPLLYSRTLLFIYSIYNSLHLLISNCQSIFPYPLPLGSHRSFLYVCESVSVLWKFIYVIFQSPHIMISITDMVSVFLFLTYFIQYDNLQVHPCCYRWHYLFFDVAEQYSTVYLYHIFFVHLSVDIQVASLSQLL